MPYSYSGTLGLVQMTVCNARLWNRLGASQLQRSICGAAAEFAVEATLGARWSVPYADVVHSKLVVLWGHNPVSTGPHFMPFLIEARRRGCTVVVIDPLRSKSADHADLHLAPLPGTDGVLAMGIGPRPRPRRVGTTKPGSPHTASVGRSCASGSAATHPKWSRPGADCR